MTQLDEQLELLLSICHEHHLTLSPRKFQLVDKSGSLIFAAHRLSARGCEPDPERMTAISEFPRPETRQHLQSLFCLIAQFQAWAPDTATATSHMRKLLLAKVSFVWTEDCEQEFIELKKILCSPLFLQPYDSSLPTTFSVDTSNLEGTGFILMQEGAQGKKRVVRCSSVAAKKSWAGLSPIEVEAVGLCWSAKSLDYYLRCCPEVLCILDHKPLQTLMEAPLESLSPRMLRACLELLPYRIKYVWAPGRCLSICDALGRRPGRTSANSSWAPSNETPVHLGPRLNNESRRRGGCC